MKIKSYCIFFFFGALLSCFLHSCRALQCPQYTQCSNSNLTTVKAHLTVHSHLDAYWIQTFEQYYYGNGSDDWFGHTNVRQLYQEAIEQLEKDEHRTQAFSEMCFFKKWFDELNTEEQRQRVKYLVQAGRIEFINGGWVQNDEALTYYEDIIDQFMLGHQFLRNQFNYTVNIASSNDNFGHSSAMTSLYSMMGFNAYVIERASEEQVEQFAIKHQLEFLWEPEFNLGLIKDSLFTQIRLKKHFTWQWETIEDLPKWSECSWLKTVFEPLQQNLLQMAEGQDSANDVLIFFGDDFTIYDQNRYQNLETAINFFNDHNCFHLNVTYSSFNEYFRSRYQQSNPQKVWHSKKTDFFPYHFDQVFWSGFYSSQPRVKLIARQASRYLQAVKNFFSKLILSPSLTNIQNQTSSIEKYLRFYEEEVAMIQHHDAITSTSKYYVLEDAISRLNSSFKIISQLQSQILKPFTLSLNPVSSCLGQFLSNAVDQVQTCNYLDNDKCFSIFSTKKQMYFLSIFNPAVAPNILIVELNTPVDVEYDIYDSAGNLLPCETACLIPEQGFCSLFFKYSFQALGIHYFTLQLKENQPKSKTSEPKQIESLFTLEQSHNTHIIKLSQRQILTISNSFNEFEVKICPNNFVVEEKDPCNTESNGQQSVIYHFSVDFTALRGICKQLFSKWSNKYYQACGGKYVMLNDPSTKFSISKIKSANYYQSSFTTIIKLQYENYVTLLLKFFPETLVDHGISIEFFYDVSSIPEENDYMFEINSKDIRNNNKIFYTDSNGLYMMRRKLNNQEDFTQYQKDFDAVQANTYPMTSISYIVDIESGLRMSVLSDRSMGVTSMANGQLNFFIERKAYEDQMGVIEPLHKLEKQRYNFQLLFTKPQQYGKERKVQQILMEQILLFNIGTVKEGTQLNCIEQKSKSWDLQYNFNLKIIARPQGQGNQIIYRVENIDYYQPLNVSHFNGDINLILSQFTEDHTPVKQVNIEELALNGATPLAEMMQNKWHWNKTIQDQFNSSQFNATPQQFLLLSPLQIRVFLVQFDNSSSVNSPVNYCSPQCSFCVNHITNCLSCQPSRENNPPECSIPQSISDNTQLRLGNGDTISGNSVPQ